MFSNMLVDKMMTSDQRRKYFKFMLKNNEINKFITSFFQLLGADFQKWMKHHSLLLKFTLLMPLR
jgi:hypothetical protein